MVADGVHTFSDLLSDFIALVTLKFGAQEADVRMHYGYRRVETLGVLFFSLLLAYVGVDLIVDAIHAEYKYQFLFEVGLIAAIAVAVKEVLFRVTLRRGIELSSPVLVANAWHHRSGSVSSIAVLFSVGLCYIFPEIVLIESITTVIIAGLILHAAWEEGVQSVKELIDFSPSLKIVALIEEMAARSNVHTQPSHPHHGWRFAHGVICGKRSKFYHRKRS